MIKVLLIGNNSKYLKDALSCNNFEVLTALNTVQTLKVLKSNNIDIILLDDIMPNIDGLQTLKAVRKINEDIPIIMLSGFNNDKTMVNCLRNGADDYIIKPFVLPNLLARMEAVLRRLSKQTKMNAKKSLSKSLTSKEKEVIKLASEGNSNREIADKLYIKEVTVKTHLNNIFKKLKVTNRMQAVIAITQK